MGRKIGVLISVALIVAVGCVIALRRPACDAPTGKPAGVQLPRNDPERPNDSSAQNTSLPVDNGFFFICGKFVDPPYVLSIVNRKVLVNGTVVFHAPSRSQRLAVPTECPPIPNSLTANSTLDQWIETRHAPRMKLFLESQYSPSEARRLFLEYLRSLPFMESVEEDPVGGWSFVLLSKSGRKLPVSYESRGKATCDQDDRLARELAGWRDRFEKGGCVFLSENGGEVSFLAKFRRGDLSRLAQLMRRADASLKEKIQFLTEVFSMDRRTAEKFVGTFDASGELERRIGLIGQ